MREALGGGTGWRRAKTTTGLAKSQASQGRPGSQAQGTGTGGDGDDGGRGPGDKGRGTRDEGQERTDPSHLAVGPSCSRRSPLLHASTLLPPALARALRLLLLLAGQ